MKKLGHVALVLGTIHPLAKSEMAVFTRSRDRRGGLKFEQLGYMTGDPDSRRELKSLRPEVVL